MELSEADRKAFVKELEQSRRSKRKGKLVVQGVVKRGELVDFGTTLQETKPSGSGENQAPQESHDQK